MRLRSSLRPTVAEVAAVLANVLLASADSFAQAPSPNLDFSQLGRIALTGDFDSISTYSFVGQNENSFTTNGTQGLLQQMPNGVFTSLAASDATIVSMCPFVRKSGQLAGIVVGGNFTSLEGTQAQGVALWDPSSNDVTPLPGLTGSVNAVYCNQATDSVYVGGDFHGGNSTNAIVWLGMQGWSNMPFAGFDGPVNAITKSPDGNIIFAGSFSTLGNTTTPAVKDGQTVNLVTANVTAGPPATQSQFADPKNIICKTADTDGAGSTWLTADNGGGYFRADFDFACEPTKLPLYNTHSQGRGTKTFRFTAFPLGGILNVTYTDPVTNQNASCTNECPLSNSTSVKYQDFEFVDQVGMDGFQIDITDFYGTSAGLDGIELFQDDIYAFAVSSLNEPSCAVSEFPSNSTATGPWSVTPSGLSGAQYLTANLKGPNVNENSAQVTFEPDIQQSGSYLVTIYTPGCQQDNSCQQRGVANVTGTFTSGGKPVTTQISQTNDFDKYDQIFSHVDANSASFRPTVTLSPLADQQNSIQLVALRVRFQLLDASGNVTTSSGSGSNSTGLNGLFEYDPTTAFSTDFAANKVDVAGSALSQGAVVNNLAVVGQTTFIAGNFTTSNFSNIFSMTYGVSSSLTDGGLNDAVTSTVAWGNLLFVGGNFTGTAKSSSGGLNRVAVYDTDKQTWSGLGNGVDAPVDFIVPLELNITSGTPETCITVNGQFTQVLASSGKPAFNVTGGLAIWVPSHNDWLHNLGLQTQSIKGQLTTATNVTGQSPLLAGTISSQGWALTDAVSLFSDSNGNVDIAPIGLTVQDPTSSSKLRKRDTLTNSFSGAVTGLFDTDNGQNITVLAGSFQATASDGTALNNLAILNSTGNGAQGVSGLASGLDSNSTFRVLSRNGSTLFAGGEVTGTVDSSAVNGLVIWDLSNNVFMPQPPALGGDSVSVLAIAPRPSTNDLYVGGVFSQAGALPCQSLCIFSGGEWNQPGSGLNGTVSNLLWQGNDQLLITGNLTVGGNATYVATYNADQTSQQWSIPTGAPIVPGPVTALASASSDNSQYWVSGVDAKNGSAYLVKYDGTNFNPVPSLFGSATNVRGLSVVTLSQGHSDTNLLDSSLALMITGNIDIPHFGNASAVLFNGTSLTPLILTNSGNKPGVLSQVVVEIQQNFGSGGEEMSPSQFRVTADTIYRRWTARRRRGSYCPGNRSRHHVLACRGRPADRASPPRSRRIPPCAAELL